jgi:hypothetical protein
MRLLTEHQAGSPPGCRHFFARTLISAYIHIGGKSPANRTTGARNRAPWSNRVPVPASSDVRVERDRRVRRALNQRLEPIHEYRPSPFFQWSPHDR